ncbi:MAG TPA: SulP family inorganic anion transporter, partial [Ramlibacter sp.]|nr:SulP family inorganic anion transporter [Ramlibacter sp.]
ARLGFLADFLSRTVLTGFLTGVGVQVALSELPGLLGVPAAGSDVFEKLRDAAQHAPALNGADLAIGVAVIALIVGARKLSRRIPGALIAVAGAIAASWALDWHSHGVSILGMVPSGLPHLGLPAVAWDWSLMKELLPTAIALAVVILAQSAATSRAYAWRYDEQFDENTDLVGLALANLGAGLSGTFVVNGSPTKTQMVDAAGGRSQIAQLATAAVVLIVLLFLTAPLAFMPTAVLSAIVFLIGLELIDIAQMRRILAVRRSEFWVALLTAAAVVIVGVERAILLAVALSLIDHTRRGYRPKNSVITAGDDGRPRLVPVSQAREFRPGLIVYRFNHAMYYANAELLSQEVVALAQRAQPHLSWFALDLDAVDDVDFSAATTLASLQKMLERRRVRLMFLNQDPHVRRQLERYGVIAAGQQEGLFDSLGQLVAAYGAAGSKKPARGRPGARGRRPGA